MRIRHLLFLLVVVLLLSQNLFAQNNPYKINDALYDYFRNAQTNLSKKYLGLRMVDTLFIRAKEMKDVKTQCIALYMRVNYFICHDSYEVTRREFDKVSPFILRTPYTQYYFGIWNDMITRLINDGKYSDALRELNENQEKAQAMRNDYGITQNYTMQGNLYYNQKVFRLALSHFLKAIEYAKQHHVSDVYNLYHKAGLTFFHLHRWKEAKDALRTSISLASNERNALNSYYSLLSTLCSESVQDKFQIENVFSIIQRLNAIYPSNANRNFLYYESMYYYYKYYRNDDREADFWLYKEKNGSFVPDSLTYYVKKAEYYEVQKNDRDAALNYKYYCMLVSKWNIDNDCFLLSAFVPQLEYQKLAHNKELLLQNQAKMQLDKIKNSEQLLKLNEERDNLLLLDKKKEHVILQNRLKLQQLQWEQQNVRIRNQRLYIQQSKETDTLMQTNEYWEMLFISIAFITILVFVLIYAYRKYKIRKILRMNKEKAENSERMKSLFFQNMNHEIRNPLNAIIGFNDILNGGVDEELPADQKVEMVRMIFTNCQLLQTLVNDVLDLSNFESGSYKLTLVDVDIRLLCRTALESVRGMQSDSVKLIFDPQPDEPYLLRTDGQRLQQVLTNYLSNACKYTDQGCIVLSYEVLRNKVRFSVTDTGCGVKADDAKKIFERFQMLDKARRGTGLGLHICRIISKLLHGRVYLDTSYTKGARFIFDHPLKLTLSLLIAFCCSFLPVSAQHNRKQKKDPLYEYYLRMDPKLNEPVGGRMADTLLMMAKRSNDVKAQCVALMSKVRFYRYIGQETEMLKAFDTCKRYCQKVNNNKAVFSSWTYVINFYLQKKQMNEAMKQLIIFQNYANKLNDKNGISTYLYTAGNYYGIQRQYATAFTYYLQSLNYDTDNKYAIYTMLGQCSYSLKDYDKTILYMKSAINHSITEVNKILPWILLLKAYSQINDSTNAAKMLNKLDMQNKEIATWVNNANYYNALYLYYKNIKKDLHKAQEAQLKSGNWGNPLNLADYYFEKGDYSKSKELYKKSVDYYNEWLTTNSDNFLDSYTSKFDYGRVMKERDRIAMNNLQMQLNEEKNNKQLMNLKSEKTALLLRQAEKDMLQKREDYELQKVLLSRQKEYMRKSLMMSTVYAKQKYLREKSTQWKILTLFSVLFLIVTGSILYIRWLRIREKKLRIETLKAERNERIKNRFFKNVNSKICHPLNTIVQLNEKLNVDTSSNYTESERTALLKQLNNSGKYLSTLVNEVLGMSKIESGTYQIYLTDVDVDLLCSTVMNDFKGKVCEGVDLRLEKDEKSSLRSPSNILHTDSPRLQFVLRAFLDNACKHTTQGCITLSYGQSKGMFRFVVTDTGIGISPQILPILFHKDFIHADDQENIGLSLYIVGLTANILHGKAYIDTSYHQGARFVFEHPLKLSI